MKPTTSASQILERMKQASGFKTDSALGSALGVKQQAVYNARNKDKIPSAWVRKIAEQFDVSADWLFFGRDPAPVAGDMVIARATAGSLTAGAPIASFVATPSGPESACSRCAALETEVKELRADLKKSQDEALTAYKLALEAARPKQGQNGNDAQRTAELLKIRDNTIKIGVKLQEAYSRIAELEEQLAEATSPTKRRNHN